LSMSNGNEFMIGHNGVPTSAVLEQVAYERGWCRRCGRRLGYAGKCPNCDAWWRSPYVMIGLPLLLINIGAIGAIVSHYGLKPSPTVIRAERNETFATTQPFGAVSGAGTAAYSHPSFAPAFQPSTFRAFNGSNSIGAGAPSVMPDPWEIRLQELNNLRGIAWQAEAEYRRQPPPMQFQQDYFNGNTPDSKKTGSTTMNAST
jgi:hypothetical protein